MRGEWKSQRGGNIHTCRHTLDTCVSGRAPPRLQTAVPRLVKRDTPARAIGGAGKGGGGWGADRVRRKAGRRAES